MATSSGRNGVSLTNAVIPERGRILGNEMTRSTRKRRASQEQNPFDRRPYIGSEPGVSASHADLSYAATESIKSRIFLRVQERTSAARQAGYQGPREDMVLYNWRTMTLSVVSANGIQESQIIKQPLAEILFRASSVLVKDTKVFASMSTSISHVVQVYDLQTGQLLKEIDSKLLSGMSAIVLSSFNNRIFAAVFGGRRIFEILPDFQLDQVAEVRVGIRNFWVEHQDESSFLCTYTETDVMHHSTYFRYKTGTSGTVHVDQREYRFPNLLIVGRHAANSYFLPNDRCGVVIAYTDNEVYDFRLAEEIRSPFSLNYCGELIYILGGEGILLIDTRTKRYYTISGAAVSQKVDEECRLIKRLIASPRV